MIRTGLSLFLNLLLCSLPSVAFAQIIPKPQTPKTNQVNNRSNQSGSIQVKVPIKTIPARRESGSVRRGSCISGEPALLALLLPSTNLGLTTAAYPQFFWYTPANTAQLTTFSLYKVDEKLRPRTVVYQTTFKPSSKNSFTSFTLPNNNKISPLEINQTYLWSVSLICNPQDSSPRSITTVYGWVQRVPVNQNLANQLQRSSQKDRIFIYAEQGLWFDLLSTVTELRACNPSDNRLVDIWVSLLQQVELGYLTQQPFQQKCPR